MLTNCSFYFHKRQQNIMNLFIEPILKKAVGRFHLFINSFMQEQFSYNFQDSRDEDVCAPCEQNYFFV